MARAVRAYVHSKKHLILTRDVVTKCSETRVMIKSYVKLYGPSLDKGIDAMDELLSNFKKRFRNGKMVSAIISFVDPSIDFSTGKLIRDGKETLGRYDYVIEWIEPPSIEQVRDLIRHIDQALEQTGCKYTITTG